MLYPSFSLFFFFLSLLNHTLISHLVLQCCFDTRSKSSRDDALFLYSFHSLHSVISSYDFLDRSIELRGWYKKIRMRSSFDGHGWIESRQGGGYLWICFVHSPPAHSICLYPIHVVCRSLSFYEPLCGSKATKIKNTPWDVTCSWIPIGLIHGSIAMSPIKTKSSHHLK